jgi:hypothetical protein
MGQLRLDVMGGAEESAVSFGSAESDGAASWEEVEEEQSAVKLSGRREEERRSGDGQQWRRGERAKAWR